MIEYTLLNQMNELTAPYWKKINLLLLEAGEADSLPAWDAVVLQRLTELVPTGAQAMVFDAPERGPKKLKGYIGNSVEERWLKAWNEKYCRIMPGCVSLTAPTFIADWRRFGKTEYAADFILPQGLNHSAGMVIQKSAGPPTVFLVHRSRGEPKFFQKEILALRELQPHLGCMYRKLEKIASFGRLRFTSPVLEKRFRTLSGRETEIVTHFLRGGSLRETALSLGISLRTAETYAERMYTKLGVAGKRELMDKILPAW